MKQYTIWNGTRIVELDESIVENFEALTGELGSGYIEYITLVDQIDKNISNEELNRMITDALLEEIEVIHIIHNDMGILAKMAEEYDKEMEIEMQRENLLRNITEKVTRDNGKEFTNTERLDYIKEVLEKSNYEIYKEKSLSVIYKKKNVDLPEKVVLISSHVDCVDEIKNPGFEITEEGDYKGTFDNAVTNAAIVIAMLEERLDDNVLIAFTGDEEEDSNGARQAIKFLKKKEKKVIGIALDATLNIESEYDDNISTYDYASYTIDNLCENTKKTIAKALFKVADDLNIPYMVTRAEGECDYFNYVDEAEYYEKKLEVEDCAYEDEAIKYSKKKCCIGTFSLCIPTDADKLGFMHSDKKIQVKKSVFHQYIEAVTEISNRIAVLILMGRE